MDASQFAQILEAFNKTQLNLIEQLKSNSNQQTQQQQNENVQPLQVLLPPFENFDDRKESFKLYHQRFENYLTMKGIIANKTLCHQMLINSIGSTHFKLLVSLIAPKSINEVEYDVLVTKLQSHLCPKTNILVSQHRFLSTYQNEEQTISEYVAILRRDINECDFVSACACKADISNIFLRAQFIRGIKDNTIREQLLQSDNAEFDQIVQKALSLEASKIDSREINAKQPTSSDVNFIQTKMADRRKNRSRYRSPRSQHRSQSRINYSKLGIDNLCIRCGKGNHKTKECRTNLNNLKCNSCGKKGHVKQVCIKSLIKLSKNKSGYEDDDSIHKIYGINKIVDIFSSKNSIHDVEKYYAEVEINGRRQKFEIDTGVGFTLIPKNQYEKLNINQPLQPSKIAFRSYTKNIIIPDGKVNVKVKYNNVTSNEEMYIVPSEYDALMGRLWIRHLKVDLRQVDGHQVKQFSISDVRSITEIINDFPDVFTEQIGCVPNYEVTLQLRHGSKPIFLKEREVPYALKKRVEDELDKLESAGIISKCERSDWGSPLVIIPKPNGDIRLCVDYKPGVNPQLVSANYPIRRIDEIFDSLKGSKYFCRLDLYKAYHHLRVTQESSEIQTMSTHKGTYRVNRLSFGIKTAPSEFNRIIEQILSGLSKTMSYFDDIIVHGATEAECRQNLIECLKRLQQYDLHLNRSKCSFFQSQIEYLGHIIQFNKILKSPKKIRAIENMPRPSNVDDVRRFLGMITYYSRFIPNMSSETYPLRQLLQKNSKFYWSAKCEAAFINLKSIISSDQVLVPFDPELPIILACDASPTGIAGVLSHIVDGIERPIAYASRSLTTAEMNYSHIDREALAIIFSINYFFSYIYGRRFKLVTDNRPLTRIFHQHNKLPAITSARLLRYAEFLSSFDYEIVFKKGSDHVNVDCFSRATMPRESLSTEKLINEEVNELCFESIFEISSEYINADKLATETSKDPELSAMLSKLLSGDDSEGKYTLNNGIIFKGQRVIIPKSLQSEILRELHNTHPGITRMKQLARRYCFWIGIDKDIENMVRSCQSCVEIQNKPSKAPLHHWQEPEENWERVHIDYAGPFQDHNFLIVVDAKSKWIEVRVLREAPSTQSTIDLLENIFATHGFPSIMVSDNAAIFTSERFRFYCKQNGIFQKLIAPGHPSTNGLAERNVQTLKRKLKAMSSESGSMHQKVNNILQRYRATPLNCGKSPAELYLNRCIRIRLDALKPSQELNSTPPMPGVRNLSVGERVQALHHKNNKTLWKTGTILKKFGRLHYLVKLDDGYTLKRHIDQLKRSKVHQKRVHFAPNDEDNTNSNSFQTQHNYDACQYFYQFTELPQQQTRNEHTRSETSSSSSQHGYGSQGLQQPETKQGEIIRRPQRQRNLPTYLQDYLTE